MRTGWAACVVSKYSARRAEGTTPPSASDPTSADGVGCEADEACRYDEGVWVGRLTLEARM